MPTLARTDGTALAYADTGAQPDGGSTLLFSHGLLMDRTMFDPQVEALRARHRCLAWDQRGHGETGPARGPFTYWDSADDAVALLDAAAVDRAVLVGMSQGGFLSLRAALRHPDRVRALVLIDTQAGLEEEAAAPLYLAMAERWAQEGYDASVASFVAGLILGDGVDHQPWLASWAAQPKESVLEPTRTLVGRDDITGRLGEISAPALVIHGTADASIAMDRAEALAAGLGDCRSFVRIDGAGHASNLSRPEVVNAAITDFLAGL